MNALTAFVNLIANMMAELFTEFFAKLSFGSNITLGSIMLAYIFLSMILKYLLGAFSDASPAPKSKEGRDQRRRTQK